MKGCLALLFIFLVSCNDTGVPKDALPPQKMQEVLWDMMRADELASQYTLTDTSYNSAAKRAGFYAAIFSSHGVTREQFAKSLDFYEKRPDLMKVMLDSMSNKREPLRPQLDNDTTTGSTQDSILRKARRDSLIRNPFRVMKSKLPKTE